MSCYLTCLFLATALLPGDPDPAGAATAFDPRLHGFSFVNSFHGDILIDVPLIGSVDVGDASYGLCGGMSFAALDAFYGEREIPDYADGPNGSLPSEAREGQALRSFVYGRQTDSLRADDARLVRRLVSWAPLPIQSNWLVVGLGERTKDAFRDKIAPAIDAGCPVPLCLVKADAGDFLPDLSSPLLPPEGFTKNHQVVAIGYRRHTAGPDHWDVDIYDPNYPDEVHTLHLKLRFQTARVRADGTLYAGADDPDRNRRGKFRGFFRTPYDARPPSFLPNPSVGISARTSALAGLGLGAGEDSTGAPPPSTSDVSLTLDDLEARIARLEARGAARPEKPSFPLEAGRTWSYAFVQQAGQGARLVDAGTDRGSRLEALVEMRIGAGEANPTRVEFRREGRLVLQEWWSWTERGLCSFRRKGAEEDYTLDPPQLFLAAANGTRTWQNVNATLGFVQSCTQSRPFEFSGPWGRSLGYRVRTEQADGELVYLAEREFVPGLGMVRERITTTRGGVLVASHELVLQR